MQAKMLRRWSQDHLRFCLIYIPHLNFRGRNLLLHRSRQIQGFIFIIIGCDCPLWFEVEGIFTFFMARKDVAILFGYYSIPPSPLAA